MTDKNDNSIEFRVIHKRRNRTGNNDDPHQCKTIVKIEPYYMKKFGIKEGDIVKISGNTKSTAAICLPMDDSDLQETDTREIKVEFPNNPEKKAQQYPKIILYGPVSCNVDTMGEWQQTVKLSKFPESQTKAENIPEAELVTLATVNIAEKTMPGYNSHLDYSEIIGFVVTKNDRVNIPFQNEWHEKKQREMHEKENQETYSDMDDARGNRHRSRTPPFPKSFQSAIVDVKPEGKSFWKITENTRFEFENVDFAKIFDHYGFTPKKLVNVVSISKQILVDDTEFTIPSLEVYSNMMKLIWYSHQRIRISESDFADIRKMNRMNRMMHNEHPRLIITLEDDLGNQYVGTNRSGGGGGSSGPDPTTMEIVSDYSWHHIFSPTLDTRAKEIVLTIKEIQWVRQNKTSMNSSSPPRPPTHMTPMENTPLPKIVIVEGPWTFRIPINQQNTSMTNEA